MIEISQSLIEEVHVSRDILIMTTTACERLASKGIDGHIERLGIGTKLMALQIAPLGSHSA